MLLEVYLFLASLGFLFFILSFVRRDQSLMFLALSMVVFFAVALASGSIDMRACAYYSEWTCTTTSSSDFGAMVFFALLALLSLLYLLAQVFGYATETADKTRMG